MKNLSSVVLVILILFLNNSFSLSAQANKIEDLPRLISKNNANAQIERLAALEFHKLLNQYRKKRYKKTPLKWNDSIWLICRNHTLWMTKVNKLTHIEKSKNSYYTGQSPSDRCDFIDNTINISYSGENALYFYPYLDGEIMETAKNIAEKSFKMWKSSAGHNSNMLGSGHRLHGAAFIIDKEGTVWSTSLFARSITNKQMAKEED